MRSPGGLNTSAFVLFADSGELRTRLLFSCGAALLAVLEAPHALEEVGLNPFARIYAFWQGIPAPMRGPIRAAAVASSLTVYTVVATLLGVGITTGECCNSAGQTWNYLSGHWWAAVIGLFLNPSPYFRAYQGYKTATSVVHTEGATSRPNPTAT